MAKNEDIFNPKDLNQQSVFKGTDSVKPKKQENFTSTKDASEIFTPDKLAPTSEYSQRIEDKNATEPVTVAPDIELQFKSDWNSSAFPDDFLIINDVYLTDVPLTGISLQSSSDVFVGEVLRASAPIVSHTGKENILLTLNLIFPAGKPQQVDLKRLMSVLLIHPFVYIHSNKIKQSLGMSEFESAIFALESGTLRSVEEGVGSIALDLNLYFFNYKPFSKHYYYNAKLRGVVNERDANTSKSQNLINVDVDKLREYESSTFSSSLMAESIKAKIQQNVLGLKDASKENTPVILPSESDAWMYYADSLEAMASPISSTPSDYIGFSLREYITFTPPSQELTDSQSSISQLLNWQLPPIHPLYKLVPSQTPIQTAQEQNNPNIPEATSDNSSDVASNSSQLATYKYGSKTLQINDSAALWLARLLTREGSLRHLFKNIWTVWCYINRYCIKGVYSSFYYMISNHSIAIDEGWLPGGKKYETKGKASQKVKGGYLGPELTAIRMATRSLPWNKIDIRIRKIVKAFQQGKVSYPQEWLSLEHKRPSDFASFTDKKGKPLGPQITPWGVGPGDGEWFFEEQQLWKKQGFVQVIPPKDTTPLKDSAILAFSGAPVKPSSDTEKFDYTEDLRMANQGKDVAAMKCQAAKVVVEKQEKAEAKADPQSIAETASNKNLEARARWILNTEEAYNVHYYYDDPKLRNVFFRDISLDISSDHSEQNNGNSLKNIVCSGLAVSFGHRLAPMRVVGQTTYSWQFLGAGNKSGQIVLTFAGREGRKSADQLKELITKARNNARLFGAYIKDAGCITLKSLNEFNNEQNVIITLANVEDVIVSEFEEATLSDAVDKHQLIISFISQSFMEEKLDQRFVTSLDSKKRLIKGLMKYIVANNVNVEGKDVWAITTTSDIARYMGFSVLRPYILAKGVPAWVANAVISTAKVCKEINAEMPPIEWKATGSELKWKDIYDEWGAGSILKGDKNNIEDRPSIPVGGTYGNRMVQDDASVPSSKDRSPPTNITDGPQTNRKHMQLFRRFTDKMEIIVREVRNHISDEYEFNKYFPGIGDELLDTISAGMGGCYDDIMLPPLPGTAIPLPPEFYIYDDSHEDPLISNMTDSTNLEQMLIPHVENELASVTRYITGCLLGGSYLSKNFPKIREQRLSEHERSKGEQDFWYYYKLAQQGTKVWDPLFVRKEELNTASGKNTKEWIDAVSSNLGGGTQEAQTLEWFKRVSKLSSYIQDKRHWDLDGKDPKIDESFISNLYNKDWSSVSFGPNISYTRVDEIKSGKIPDPNLDRLSEATKKQIKMAVASDVKNIILDDPENKVQSLPDGSITVGDTEAEKSAESGLVKSAMQIGAFVNDVLDSPIVKSLRGFLGPIGALLNLSDSAANVKQEADKVVSAYTATQIRKITHPISEKLSQMKEAANISKVAASYALGNRFNDLSMRRAYPTFKIYFIEDDSEDNEVNGGTVLRAFDDFYSYSAIQEISITSSRKIAGDLAVIRMTNIGGLLLRKRFGEKEQANKRDGGERQGIFADTGREHPFERMVLQNGVKVQIRLGYSSRPDDLETRFLGRIVEISPTEDGKILEIMCQGCGAELDNVELGPLEKGPIFFSTQQALSAAIIQDSITSFGRQDRYNSDNPAAARHAWTGGKGYSILADLNPANLVESWADSKMDALFQRYSFLNYPQDDNIYAPPPDAYSTTWERWWNNACTYRPLKQTAWEIFKEHELRHPGYVSLPVPYGHASRMTMFFGCKAQHYWSKAPSQLEVFLAETAKSKLIQLGGMGVKLLSKESTKIIGEMANYSPKLVNAVIEDAIGFGVTNNVGFALGEAFGRYVPFRNYLYADSQHHILKNEIRTSIDDTYNEIEVTYTIDENVLKASSKKQLTVDYQANSDVLAVKLDENIPEYALRSLQEEYPSCVTIEMARRYVQGLFARHMREAYKGELIVIGNEKIKPYDIIFINDMSINMTGPIEVEAVTHLFNRDNGFVSIISPDLCVEVNDYYTVASFDMAAAANATVWGDYPGCISPLKGISFLGLWAGAKFAMWTQEGSPILATPLTLGGKPFLSNTLGPNQVSFIMAQLGKWRQYWDDFDSAWSKFDLSEELFQMRIGLSKSLYGTLGTGATGGGESLVSNE